MYGLWHHHVDCRRIHIEHNKLHQKTLNISFMYAFRAFSPEVSSNTPYFSRIKKMHVYLGSNKCKTI